MLWLGVVCCEAAAAFRRSLHVSIPSNVRFPVGLEWHSRLIPHRLQPIARPSKFAAQTAFTASLIGVFSVTTGRHLVFAILRSLNCQVGEMFYLVATPALSGPFRFSCKAFRIGKIVNRPCKLFFHVVLRKVPPNKAVKRDLRGYAARPLT